MAGTSTPFLLYPTGVPAIAPGQAGFRSLFAFWIGGASAPPFTPHPPSPAQSSGTVGGFGRRYRKKPRYEEIEDKRRAALRSAYIIISRNARKLTRELRREVLNAIVHEGNTFPPVSDVDFYAFTIRPQDLELVEGVFARAIVEAELPEPKLPPNEPAPLVELEGIRVAPREIDAAPDGAWAIGMPAALALAKKRRLFEELMQDDEEVLLLLS